MRIGRSARPAGWSRLVFLRPRRLAMADQRRYGILRSSYFVMQTIKGAAHLGEHRERNKKAIREVARLLGRLHDSGLHPSRSETDKSVV